MMISMKANKYDLYFEVEIIYCWDAPVFTQTNKILDHLISPFWSVGFFQATLCSKSKQDALKDLLDCKHKFQAYNDRPLCHLASDNQKRCKCDVSIRAIDTGIHFKIKNSLTKTNYRSKKALQVLDWIYMTNESYAVIFLLRWV